jgi:endo-1,4-beta-D-glucanase Y
MTIKAVRRFFVCLGLAFSLLSSAAALAQNNSWDTFKNRFLMPDGRIIDTSNSNVSHTEGQGFSMLLAVFNNDKTTFDQMWTWANNTLYRQDIGLYSWRYDPNAKVKVADKNNASDGDVLMAWALLLAGDKWSDSRYTKASEKLQAALLKHTVIDFSGHTVMLPGVSGFNQTSSIVLNPSYFIFPAWQAFYKHSRLKVWKTLNDDGLDLLGKMKFGTTRLPTDWVTMQADGSMVPADRWPPRFGFDAVRIPLYVRWAQPNSPALAPFITFWQGFPRENTPAWIDVLSGSKAEYPLSPGMLAIRDLTLGNLFNVSGTLQPNEDYYSSCLHLLTWWSMQR